MARPNTTTPSADLEGLVSQLLRATACTKEEHLPQLNCLRALTEFAAELGETWMIRPFGSAANGFSTKLSDLDVTCYDTAPKGATRVSEADALRRMQPLLEKSPKFVVNEIISGARIPILKVRFEDKLNIDLSFQNTDCLLNTQLLRAYAQFHPAVRDLGVLLKLWANAEGVCGAKNGHLSAYAFVLMTIYVLQVDSFTKMPCLPVWEFDGGIQVPDCAKVKWEAPVPVHILLQRFFEFYAMHHYWGGEVVSVRVGQRLRADDSCFSSLPGREHSQMIHIEDPFILTRNLHCHLVFESQPILYNKILEAHRELENGRVPHGLMLVALQLRRSQITLPAPLTDSSEDKLGSSSTGLLNLTAYEHRQQPSNPGARATKVKKKAVPQQHSSEQSEPEPELGSDHGYGTTHGNARSTVPTAATQWHPAYVSTSDSRHPANAPPGFESKAPLYPPYPPPGLESMPLYCYNGWPSNTERIV